MDPSNITSLPTDSLYKFMALAGLLIVLSSVIFIEYLHEKMKSHTFSLRKRLAVHTVKMKWFSNELGKQADKIQRIKNQLNAPKSDKGAYKESAEKSIEPEVVCEITALEIASNEHREKTIQFESITEEMKVETEELMELRNQLSKLRKIRALVLIIGLAVTVTGFYLWYVKIQQYSDLEIALRAGGPNQ